jgi:hypothetical protein
MQPIDKFYFLVHPTCWSQHLRNGAVSEQFLRDRNVSPGDWFAALNWEREAIARQMALIRGMRANEAMVIYPIGESAPMRQLIDHAVRTLGERCIVQTAPVHPPPAVLSTMKKPIRHFLEDEQMEGRDEFWAVVPPSLREPMKSEIRRACERHGWNWSPAALKVIQGNRVYADEIAREIRTRGLQVDPVTVEAEAFGEGFEECAMTWKAMVAHYLGWRRPIENDFGLSVSGFPVLFDAAFKERISMRDHVRLFLWKKSRGRPLALFARAQCLLTDPRLCVLLPLGKGHWEIWAGPEKVWPSRETKLEVHRGYLRVPVHSAIRLHPMDTHYYIMGPDLPFAAFRDVLTQSELVAQEAIA